LPRRRRDVAGRLGAADLDLHDLPFAALYECADAGPYAIHLTVGIGIGIGIVAVVILELKRRTLPVEATRFEAVALYWHLVDTIWIFLLPMLYLIGRA
jgi:cytochrome c oxidase subunit 3